jgi:hypothetical protein
VKIYGGALLVLALIKAGWFMAMRSDAGELVRGGEREQLLARKAYLVQRLLGESATAQQMKSPGGLFEGEWFVGSLSMTATASANLAFLYPETRAVAVEEIARLIDRALTDEARAFDARMWHGEDALASLDGPNGHAGYLGHLSFMMGAFRLVGGDGRFEERHRAVTLALARRMEASPSSFIETYPGETYAMDNSVVAAAVAVRDLAASEDHHALLARWISWSREKLLDPETGLVSFSLDARGLPNQRSRGSGAGWNSFYLPFVDEVFAHQQFARLKEQLVDNPLFITGVRELRRGLSSRGDVDSGPVLLGLSPSGSGFAMAGARREKDLKLLQGLLDTAELAGSSFQWGGRRRYLLAPFVGDAIVLAMVTAVGWDRRFVVPGS